MLAILSGSAAMAQLGGVGPVPLQNGYTVAPNVSLQVLNCIVFATPLTVRAEGHAELLGDLGLNCSGALQLNSRNWRVGTDAAPAASLPQLMNISITLAVPVTTRLVGGSNMTGALLFLQ